MVLMGIATTGASGSLGLFAAVYVVGFIAAIAIGSIAWYNSKRPAGWEDKERPNVIPKVDTEENS